MFRRNVRTWCTAALATLVLAILLAMAPGGAAAGPQDDQLRLRDGRPFCEAYDCRRLLPDADRFRRADLEVPVLEALKDGEVYAYLFLSTDLVDIPAYSGKPLVTLIAMDPQGTILGATVVHHKEPILLVGIPESVLDEFASQYVGHSILDQFEVVSRGALGRQVGGDDGHEADRQEADGDDGHEGDRHEADEDDGQAQRNDMASVQDIAAQYAVRGQAAAVPAPAPAPKQPDTVRVDMITGATVTALVLDETVLTSARKVGEALGLVHSSAHREITWHADYVPKTWGELVAEGSIGHLHVPAREMDPDAAADEAWIDLYFGDVTQPVVGRNLLSELTYEWLQKTLQPGQRALFVVANGLSSFKGSGFVRGGIFDRFHVEQGLHKFTFKDLDYENLYGLQAKGAPDFKESGLFLLRDTDFDATRPWSFVFLTQRLTGETARAKEFRTFTTEYQLPDKYYDVVETAVPSAKTARVLRLWRDKLPEVALLSVFLLATMGVFFARPWLRRSARRLEAVHVAVMVASVVIVGLVLRVPPSVTQLFPLAHSVEDGWRWKLFLSDPLLFVFWVFIAVSLVLWGRGWFCGWVCPYGGLLELVHRISRRVLPKRWLYEMPDRAHNVFRRVRYGVFIGLLALSVVSVEWAERLAEAEPFKTTWLVGVFERDWYLALYWWVLLGVSVFTFRFFCRYLCPLGAALSIGTALRLIGIRRKDWCTRCKICAHGCDSRAINARGEINKYECLYCMECEQKYHDDTICPPLVMERRRAAREAGGKADVQMELPAGGNAFGFELKRPEDKGGHTQAAD